MGKRDDDFYLLMRPLRHDHSSSCVGLSMHAGDEMGDGGYGVETGKRGLFLCTWARKKGEFSMHLHLHLHLFLL